MRFAGRTPLSGTARLDFVSRHRTQPSADAVLLMADSCVLGPEAAQPRRLPRLAAGGDPVTGTTNDLYCRTAGGLEIDGVACTDRGPLHQELPRRGRRVFVQPGGDWRDRE